VSAPTTPQLVRVDQTRFGRGEGNCFAACIASITGLDLNLLTEQLGPGGGTWDGDVWVANPDEEHWFTRAERVLATLGWQISYDTAEVPDGYAIYSGPAARGLLHSCVGIGGEVVHDPHPSRAGLIEVTDYITLIPSGASLGTPPTTERGGTP
jgi:hypothetical protein